MKTLYLFTQTPNEKNINFVKKLVDKSDCIVFIQNGVYFSKHKVNLNCLKYVIKSDVEARGVEVDIKIINYDGLIDLFFAYERTVVI